MFVEIYPCACHFIFQLLSSLSPQAPAAQSGAGGPGQCPHQTPPWEAPPTLGPLLVPGLLLGLCLVPALGPPQVPLTAWWAPVLAPPPLVIPNLDPLDIARTTCSRCIKWVIHHIPRHSAAGPMLLVVKFIIYASHRHKCITTAPWSVKMLINF